MHCNAAKVGPIGLILASAIDYRLDAIVGLMRFFTSNQNCSFNYVLLLHLPHLQLCTLTIYGNIVVARHINYLKKST